jgi:hypothetical protein
MSDKLENSNLELGELDSVSGGQSDDCQGARFCCGQHVRSCPHAACFVAPGKAIRAYCRLMCPPLGSVHFEFASLESLVVRLVDGELAANMAVSPAFR